MQNSSKFQDDADAGLTDWQPSLFCHTTNKKVPCQIKIGQSAVLTLRLDSQWASEKALAIDELLKKHSDLLDDPQKLSEKLIEYNLADFHWSWLAKSFSLRTTQHQWFYLMCQEKIQGVCIIYFPKTSKYDNEDIFYIDYVATAYENRERPGHQKKFSNAGKVLIATAIDYCTNGLGYRPGFSLEALPSAESYYIGLGMESFPSGSPLKYFEANAECAIAIREAAK